ncbi:MAG: tetratricopeptide repeat protein [Ignavibacteriae bacterium]|nr:tetratricopeptide repeat protein [Ignavibacteriota bacterium]
MKLYKALVIVCCVFFITLNLLAQNRFEACNEALKKGDYQTAISCFKDATRKDKKNPNAFIGLGTALLKADSTDEAQRVLFQARELDSQNPQVYVLLGDSYMKQNIPAAATGQYEQAIKLDSTNPELFLKLGEAYRKSRQWNDAAEAYHKVISLDSVNIVALRELSSIYFRAKKWANAVKYLDPLVRLQPDSLNYQFMYVKSLYENKRFKDMIPVAELLLKKDPSLTDVIQPMLAEAYQVTGQTKLVIEALEKLNRDSLKVDDLVRLARAYQSDQQNEKAEEIYLLLFTKDSTRCDVRYYFGTNEMKLKKWSEAVKQFEMKIECDTSAGYRFASYLNAAMCLMQMKDFKKAKDYILKSIEYRPDDVRAWQTLAQCYGLLEQTKDEIAAYKKVIELATTTNSNGNEEKYSVVLCDAYRMVGVRLLIDATKDKDPETNKAKYLNSTDYLKKALQCNPKDCELNLWLAQAYQNAGNKEEAKKYYCRVLDYCPKAKQADDAKKGLDVLGFKCGQ